MIVFSGESVSLPATFITHRILTIDYHEYTNRIINYRCGKLWTEQFVCAYQ